MRYGFRCSFDTKIRRVDQSAVAGISEYDPKPNTNNKQSTSAIILALRKCLHSGKSHKETIAIWHTRCEQPEHCFGSK